MAALSVLCFQAINMSIQCHYCVEAFRNRWFVQTARELGFYITSWHTCSQGLTPTMHLTHAATIEVFTVVLFSSDMCYYFTDQQIFFFTSCQGLSMDLL